MTYDADGNMTSGLLKGSLQNFTFDCRNRLTAVGSTSYSYDAENNRIGVTVSSQAASYVINPQAGLSQVLVKTDPDATKTYYVYGLGLIGEETGGSYKSYHYDLRGSTVALTSINGTIIERFQYGPYGEIQWVTGVSSISFLYNGRDGVITDDNGLYYMRARYYNPDIMRFMSRDELLGNILDPMSFNRFAYVQGNPVIGIDPLGYGANFNLNDLSDFNALISESQDKAAANAHLNQLAEQFDTNYGVSSSTSVIGLESTNQGTTGRCSVHKQSIAEQIWAGMSQVPGAVANALRELPGAIFNKDVAIATGKTVLTVATSGGWGSLKASWGVAQIVLGLFVDAITHEPQPSATTTRLASPSTGLTIEKFIEEMLAPKP